MKSNTNTILRVLRFLIAIESSLAATLYIIYLPHKYGINCVENLGAPNSPLSKILCPTPSFVAQPNGLLFIIVDALIVTALVYTFYLFIAYVSKRKTEKQNA